MDENGVILTAHAWFTCFAPYDDPEIAITVFVYGGGEGAMTAMPVAEEILNYYFQLY
jgi:penicillin-binding protein 2